MNFYEEQLQKEIKFIENKYLPSIIEYDTNIKVENDFIVKNIILNGIPYKMYRKISDHFDVLFIPNDLSNKDFDNIIKYKKTNEHINFTIISKKNNYVELFNYDFLTNENNYSCGNYFHNEFVDNNNLIELNNIGIPQFLCKINIKNLNNCLYRLDRIKRNNTETKLNRINEKSLLKAYQLYDSRFNQIDDNESPLLEILENLYKKDKEKIRI